MTYQTPKIEICLLDESDVLTASGERVTIKNGGDRGSDQVVGFGSLEFK